MDLAPYIKACYSIIYVLTPEETRAELMILKTAQEMKRRIKLWSHTDGFKTPGTGKDAGKMVSIGDAKDVDPVIALLQLRDSPKTDKISDIIVMRDLHMFLGSPAQPNAKPVRLLRDISTLFKKSGDTLIIISPIKKIPAELERDITIIELELPSREEIQTIFASLYTPQAKKFIGEITPDEQERTIQAAMGLTFGEADNAFAKAFVEYGGFDKEKKALEPVSKLVLREKAIAVKKSGILEYFEPKQTSNDIGGLENLKSWLKIRSKAFTKKAREFGLPPIKGILLAGPPGTGKSLSAKVASHILGLPLLRFDIGKVFGGLVGESVAPTEEILFYTNNGVKRLTIEEAYERQSELQDAMVSSYTPKMNHELKKVNGFIRHERKNDVVRVTTTSGRHIDVTTEHSLFTVGAAGMLEEISASQLVKGTFIAIPMAPIETNLVKEFNILDLIITNHHEENWYIENGFGTYGEELRKFVPPKNYYAFKEYSLNVKLSKVDRVPASAKLVRHGPGKDVFEQKLILTENFMELLGWFVAEGSFSGKAISRSVSSDNPTAAQPRLSIHKDEASCITSLIESCGYSCEVYSDKDSNGCTVFFGGAGLGFILQYLGFRGNASRIPEWVFGTSAKLRAAFIRGFFSGDGGVSGHNIESSQAVEHVIHDMKLLLSSIGIHGRSYHVKPHLHMNSNPNARRLSISTANMIKKYKNLVGFTQPFKTTKASEMSLTENGQWIPVFSTLRERCKAYRNKMYAEGGSDFNISGASVNLRMAEKMMPEVSKWEIVFEEIKSVERLTTQPKYVYDISVEDNHNFVAGFGGVLCHNSERGMRTAIQTAEMIGSCVLFMDEIDKAFAGMGKANSSDSGVTQRVFGQFLTFMNDKTTPCFIIATVNQIDGLPPELLRKGRFDEIFFVGLPSAKEREQIFKVHLRLNKQIVDDSSALFQECIKLSKGFSGAEIEAVVISAMYQAFDQDRVVSVADLVDAVKITNPLSRSKAAELKGMIEWAKANAVNASKPDPEEETDSGTGFASAGRQLQF